MSRSRILRAVALVVVVALPLLGMSGVASAAKVKAAKGCHKTHTCKKKGGGSGSGGTGGGGTGGVPVITVQVDPNPLVETGPSQVNAVIQVETSPLFAGDPVDVSSLQLVNACGGGVGYLNDTTGGLDSVTLTLDDDGNAAVVVEGSDCAPGQNLIEADLDVAPYITGSTTLVVSPPSVTTPGVFGFPTTSGTVTTGEVETGDTATSGDSDVLAVFYVETDPVYAEMPVEISSSQLENRCGTGFIWTNTLGGGGNTSVLDNDGNAVFVFFGTSCAAGSSVVTADIEAGVHSTYTTNFNINPPQLTV